MTKIEPIFIVPGELDRETLEREFAGKALGCYSCGYLLAVPAVPGIARAYISDEHAEGCQHAGEPTLSDPSRWQWFRRKARQTALGAGALALIVVLVIAALIWLGALGRGVFELLELGWNI